jgi:hypothetical protein
MIRIEKIKLDGQSLLKPTVKQWQELFMNPVINESKIYLPKWLQKNISLSFINEEMIYCISKQPSGNFIPLSILQINEELLRVHFESIICENCEHRAFISATPDVIDSYLGLSNENRRIARERANKFPNLGCSKCNHVNIRRKTIWKLEKERL